jgi:hypothetical protein
LYQGCIAKAFDTVPECATDRLRSVSFWASMIKEKLEVRKNTHPHSKRTPEVVEDNPGARVPRMVRHAVNTKTEELKKGSFLELPGYLYW